jgi:hypothetical protein
MFSQLRKLEKHCCSYFARDRTAPRLFERLFLATLFFRRGLLFTGLRLLLAPLFSRRWLFLPGLLRLLLAF